MIAARRNGAGTTIHLSLGATTVVFDREWLPAGGSGPVGGFVLGPDGQWSWCGASGQAEPVELEAGLSVEDAGRRLIGGLAAAALREAAGRGRLEVVGDGVLAQALRAAGPATGDGSAPGTVVDTTGRIPDIVASIEHLQDLGTLVLAAPDPAEEPAVDLYPHVHLRGLRVIGLGAPAPVAPVNLYGPPARIQAGSPLPDAGWYCVTAA